MRRRLAMLLSATLVAATAAVLVPASPASAGVHVCGLAGSVFLGQGLTYPVTVAAGLTPPLPPNPHPIHFVVQQPRTTTFGFSLNILGGCVNSNPPNVKSPTLGTSVTADGVVSGWCGLSSGTGTLHLGNNPRFAWVDVGGVLVVTGGLTGVVHATPDTFAGDTCNSNFGADQFIFSGLVVAYDHCNPALKHLPPFAGDLAVTTDIPPGVLQTTLISGPLGTPLALVSIHAAGTWHVWTKLCVPIIPPPL